MAYSSDLFLYKKLSTALCLAIIFLASSIVAAYCFYQSAKLKELQKPLPYYVSVERTLNASSTE